MTGKGWRSSSFLGLYGSLKVLRHRPNNYRAIKQRPGFLVISWSYVNFKFPFKEREHPCIFEPLQSYYLRSGICVHPLIKKGNTEYRLRQPFRCKIEVCKGTPCSQWATELEIVWHSSREWNSSHGAQPRNYFGHKWAIFTHGAQIEWKSQRHSEVV